MTDITPVPQEPTPISVMSVEQIHEIERKLRENKAAALRKEAAPHEVSKEEIRAAINAIKMQRGTMGAASAATSSKSSGGAKKAPVKIDLGDLDI